MAIKSMTLEQVKTRIGEIKKGTFGNVVFYSTPKTTDGSIIYKVAETQIRTKIDHTKMKNYVEPTYHRTEDSIYEIDNALKTNNKTGNTLFKVAPKWDTYKIKFFEVDGITEIPTEIAKTRIKETTKSVEPPLIITINAEKIIKL